MEIKFVKWDQYNRRQKDILKPSWFALSNTFHLDSKIQKLTVAERFVTISLLCQCSLETSSGQIQINLSTFSRQIGVRQNIVISTIEKLLAAGICTAAGNTQQDRTIQYKEYSIPELHTNEIAFESVYKEYPRKKNTNKGGGMKSLHKKIRTSEELGLAIAAVRNYKLHIAKEKTKPEHIMMFSTFFGSDDRWKEFLEQPQVEQRQYTNTASEYTNE